MFGHLLRPDLSRNEASAIWPGTCSRGCFGCSATIWANRRVASSPLFWHDLDHATNYIVVGLAHCVLVEGHRRLTVNACAPFDDLCKRVLAKLFGLHDRSAIAENAWVEVIKENCDNPNDGCTIA